MQQFNLGDYKGGRENLSQIMAHEMPQHAQMSDFIGKLGQISAQNAMGRQAKSQLLGQQLASTLAMNENAIRAKMEESNALRAAAGLKEENALTAIGDELEGYNQGAIDWANNVLQSRNPDDPDYKQAVRTISMLGSRPRGNPLKSKGYTSYMAEHGIYDPFAQGALGRAAAQKQKPPEQKKTIYNNGNYRDIDSDLHN